MPRDSGGNYTLPALGNPAVTGTPITIAWWNGTSTDMATAFTDSLSRSGLGGMLVPFKLVDGTVTAPAFAFQSESNTGFYLNASGDMRVAILGADVFKWTSTVTTSLQTLVVTGAGVNGRGGTFSATGTEQGLVSTGGSSGGSGMWGIAGSAAGFGAIGQGVGGGVGVQAYSSSASVDVLRADGYVDLSHAGAVGVNTAFANRITPKNITKVWALLHTDGAGNITASNGFNVASVSVASATVTLNFASNFAATTYAVIATAGAASVGQPAVVLNTRAVGSCTFKLWDMNAAALYNLATVAMDITVQILGVQ